MRRFLIALSVVSLGLGITWASDPAEKPVSSPITSVALFKNGIAVVKRKVNLPEAGAYRLADVPEPVHGTFWVEGNGPIEARVEMRETPAEKASPLGMQLQDELADLKVTLQTRSGKMPIVGVVIKPIKKVEPASDVPPDPIYRSAPEASSRFLILKTEKGISYVDLNEIVSLQAEGEPHADTRLVKKPVLLLNAAGNAGDVQVSYLAHGLSWAPSYKVELTNAKSLSIEQHAVIRNEMSDLKDTEVSLISGYPSVQFANVVSPLAATQNWAVFFQQLNGTSRYAYQSSVMSQQASVYSNSVRVAEPSPTVAPNTGDTIDLFYHTIGKRTLKKGAAIALTTGKASAEYERIVDWTIPDNRDEWGSINRNSRNVDPNSGEQLQDDIWDALKFKNPLPFPMTSAPAMVTSGDQFNGQRQVLWTNRGEEATLRVNKAFSIRARNVEYENQTAPGAAEREVTYIADRRFRKVTVNGELRLCNHRQADIKMIIKRQFSGDYLKGDGNPKIDLREEGVWTVNKRNELTWTLILKPGEDRVVKYQYTILIHF